MQVPSASYLLCLTPAITSLPPPCSDCDYVLEVPTVSGRHLRLEAQRRPDAKGGYSRLLLTDLGSTNGTRVNRCGWVWWGGVRVGRVCAVALTVG